MSTLADVQATGDPLVSMRGVEIFNAETDMWNAAVFAFNKPSSAVIAATGAPMGEMLVCFGRLTKAVDDYVTRVDSGDEPDFRDDPDTRPPTPVNFVRIAPRRDHDHPWYGLPPITSSRGADE
jgi:hypothetical protein